MGSYCRFQNKQVRFHCDNIGVVQEMNSQKVNSPPVVRLLCHLFLKGLVLNEHFTAVPGVKNSIADSFFLA